MNLLPANTLTGVDRVHNVDLFTLCNALPSASVDMILCDLPYGVTAIKEWDNVIPFTPMWDAFKRVIKPRGAIVLTAAQPFTSALVMSNLRMFKYAWVWDKVFGTGFLDAAKRPLRQHEDVLVFAETMPRYFPQMTEGQAYKRPQGKKSAEVYRKLPMDEITINDGKRYPKTIITFSNADRSEVIHPTQKPVALFEYLIRTYTQEGDLVLDPCVGSGTTAVAARNCKRRFICGDTSAEYVAIARDRLRLPFERRHVAADNDVSDLPLFATGAAS